MAPSRRHALAITVALALAVIHLGLHANLPQIYWFATPAGAQHSLSGLLATPLALDDDPMITLRSALFVLRQGWPLFNPGDVAQASTSYLLPYLAAGLLALLPGSGALLALSLLGLLASLVSLAAVLLAARNLLWGAFLATLLALTSTLSLYAAQGWDHVYQTPFLLAGVALALRGRPGSRLQALLLGLTLLVGCALRPDGGLIALACLAAWWLRARGGSGESLGRWLAPAAFLLPGAALLLANRMVFGHLTPTTSRLKIGAVTGLGPLLRYVADNALLSWSAMSCGLVLLLLLLNQRRQLNLPTRLVVAGAALSLLYAVLARDVFGGFRMAWTPACCLALVAALALDPPLAVRTPAPVPLALAGLFLVACISFPPQLLGRLKGQRQFAPASETAQQYELARWIDGQLNPADGAIGWYQLGTAFYLPRFAAADFLGKADEAIATLPPHRGQAVGHNKWDIALTLRKWQPQAIVHAWAGDLAAPGEPRTRTLAHAAREYANGAYYAHTLYDPAVRNGYQACVPRDRSGSGGWGLLLRNDLAERHGAALQCLPLTDLPGVAPRP